MSTQNLEPDQAAWLTEKFETWTTEIPELLPSQWAEQKRYLPASVTSQPGFFSFEVTPFMREPLDCLALDSPIREVNFKKGAQVTYTTAILENGVGYLIEHVKTAPGMLVTADAELAKLRMDGYITPMLQNSDLGHLVKSDDQISTRKTGKTDARLSWQGGGFLVPFGAQNANKLRSLSICWLLNDENDGWPLTVGRDGDPYALVKSRTNGFEQSRKILNGSTPTLKDTSKIDALFARGDQRYYYVPCLECGHMQRLRWRRVNSDTGEVSGLTWDLTEAGHLDMDSVRYLCSECGHAHRNEDKTRMFDPENGAEWRPTATPVNPTVRSYHLSALYSPVGMQSWAGCVQAWLEAWDVENNRVKDEDKLQVFYNNILGESYELRGDKLKPQQIHPHRRRYQKGQVPNKMAQKWCNGKIAFLCCTVDVQKDWLAVAVWGFARGHRTFCIDYQQWEGDCSDSKDPGTWKRLEKFIEDTEYVADDGSKYRIELTAIDSGYSRDTVYTFCGEYDSGVIATKGREDNVKGAHMKHFTLMKNMPHGVMAYTLAVDAYKDRMYSCLKREWSGLDEQPERHPNFPEDITDKELKELTVETKRRKINQQTKKVEGYYWHRPQGSRNELWDLMGMALFILDLMGHNVCPPNEDEGEFLVNWTEFYDICEREGLFLSA
jgi:phage terminase large subunit GpA-like protein